jgi:hypothetical protein
MTTGNHVVQTEMESLTVNGAPAFRWETETKPYSPFVAHLTDISTLVEGESEIVWVKIYGPTKKVTQAREKILAIGESIAWHGKDAIPLPADSAPSAAP